MIMRSRMAARMNSDGGFVPSTPVRHRTVDQA
jgi:hypothetical protein